MVAAGCHGLEVFTQFIKIISLSAVVSGDWLMMCRCAVSHVMAAPLHCLHINIINHSYETISDIRHICPPSLRILKYFYWQLLIHWSSYNLCLQIQLILSHVSLIHCIGLGRRSLC